MTNHVHLVFRSTGEQKPELVIGDFKRFTSKAIVNARFENPRKAGNKSSNVYCSNADYAGEKGILEDVIVVK